jgi:dCTP deaminase
MSIKSDLWIEKMALEHQMIEPFCNSQVSKGTISYGLSSYGYDIKIANIFKILKVEAEVIDPKNIIPGDFNEHITDYYDLPPNSFVLGRSTEYFRIPRNVLTLCMGKSTYARCGIIINVTPFEPEWEGFVTISISNTASKPVRIYANEGICQVIFFQSDENCRISYADKKGKYQAQKIITPSKISH